MPEAILCEDSRYAWLVTHELYGSSPIDPVRVCARAIRSQPEGNAKVVACPSVGDLTENKGNHARRQGHRFESCR
jgi:hypothetical protein